MSENTIAPICHAANDPGSVLPRRHGETDGQWQERAVERAIALAGWRQYGGTAGPGAWPYTMTIWEGTMDGPIAESGIPVPSPPAVGTTVLHEGRAWDVTGVQVLLPGARSRAAERGYPVHVEVIARRIGDPEAGQ